MNTSKKLFFLLSFFLLVTVHKSAYAQSCKSVIDGALKNPYFTKEAFLRLNQFESSVATYPKINRESKPQDIYNTISEFRSFADSLEQTSNSLDDLSRTLLVKFLNKLHDEIDRFENWYHPGRKTDELYRGVAGIVATNARIRGAYFEMRVGFLLIQSGFKDIQSSVLLRDFRKMADVEDVLTDSEKRYLSDRAINELDFIATKNGVSYLIELKSYIPSAQSYFFRNLEKTKEQMRKRSEYLDVLRLRPKWKTVLIFQYNIAQDLLDQYFSGLVDDYFGLEDLKE